MKKKFYTWAILSLQNVILSFYIFKRKAINFVTVILLFYLSKTSTFKFAWSWSSTGPNKTYITFEQLNNWERFGFGTFIFILEYVLWKCEVVYLIVDNTELNSIAAFVNNLSAWNITQLMHMFLPTYFLVHFCIWQIVRNELYSDTLRTWVDSNQCYSLYGWIISKFWFISIQFTYY